MRHSARTTVVILIGLVGLVSAAVPASANAPVRTFLTTSPMTLQGFCPFPVHTQDRVKGAPVRETDFFDHAGNLIRVVQQGSLITTVTNLDTGKSVTVRNSGTTRVSFNSDGSITLRQTGWDITGDQGVLTGHAFLTATAGRVVAVGVPDSATGFIDFTSVHQTGNVIDLCAALS